VRKDLQAVLQMSGQFVNHDERSDWTAGQKEISRITHSFSGQERNRLFLNSRAEQFLDLSGLSGLDSPADGRVFVQLDYNRDGWIDFAVVNSSRPLLQLYRNRLGSAGSKNGFIAVRIQGGNSHPVPSAEWSNRDGWGAKVLVTLDTDGRQRPLLRQFLCGEGLAGQNSSTMLIGMDQASHARQIKIEWPSGKTQTVPRVKAGSLVTVFENPLESTVEECYRIEDYSRILPDRPATSIKEIVSSRDFDVEEYTSARLTVVTTTASWCAACARHQPLLQFLSDSFEPGQVGIVAFPIDREDSADDLREFVSRHRIAYPVWFNPGPGQREEIELLLNEAGCGGVLPSSLVVDETGRVLLIQKGIPSVSQLRQLLQKAGLKPKSVQLHPNAKSPDGTP